ncbi:MAG: glycosyltransferase involved in cell wall biosynthesis, partial [Kiritimatiellia bacterium]
MNLLAIRLDHRHWGKYSGYQRFLYAFDDSCTLVEEISVLKDPYYLPLPTRLFRKVARGFIRTGSHWYAFEDYRAEQRAAHFMQHERVDVVHFLDTEHSFYYLHEMLKRKGCAIPALVGSFHQPPDKMVDLVDPALFDILDRIVVVTPDQVDYFAQFKPRDQIDVIPLGIDTQLWTPPTNRVFDHSLKLLTVGQYFRDYEALIKTAEALKDHSDIQFTVLSRVLDPDTVPDNMQVLHYVSDDELVALYRESDLLLLPMKKATANNALVEAMACGLPILATDLDGTQANAPGDECRKFPTNDPNVIRDAILALKNDPDFRQHMSTCAR